MDITDVTIDDLLDDLCDALDRAIEPIRPDGEGWFTLAEIVEHKGWTTDRVRTNMERLMRRGLAEKRRVGVVNYYRLVSHD